MPLVFIHGVNTRKDAKYDKRVKDRDDLFRQNALTQLVVNPQAVRIFNPYWGDVAAKLRWNHASLPPEQSERFGANELLIGTLLSESATPLPENSETVLLTIARGSLKDAVDLLMVAALDQAADSDREALVLLAAKAIAYADHNPQPAWLAQVNNDDEFYAQFRSAINAWQPAAAPMASENGPESFGIPGAVWSRVRQGFGVVIGTARSLGSGLVLSMVRRPLHVNFSVFLGDAFVYLQERGDKNNPGPIVNEIVQAQESLEAAIAAKSPSDPCVIVVAHSMGGNIIYDILTHFRPDIEVDFLVTVGSQVALFEELKLYKEKHPGVPADPKTDRVPKPPNVSHWLNVYDTNDVLSFAAMGVFSGVQDFEYSTGTGLLSAHSTYFQRPSFHARLGERLKGLLP